MSGGYPVCPMCGKLVPKSVREFRANTSVLSTEAAEGEWWVTLFRCECGYEFPDPQPPAKEPHEPTRDTQPVDPSRVTNEK